MEISADETLLSRPWWIVLPLLVGFVTTIRFLFSILQWTYVYVIRPGKNLAKYGQWVVITGPTDGIGKAMAFELARKGMNLVLVGRNPEKLFKVSCQIKAEIPSIELRTVVIDFSGDLIEGVARLREAIKDIDIGMLINNAGVSQINPKFFHEIDEITWANMVNVNLLAPTIVTSVVLPCMVRKRRGAVINVGSGSTVVIPSYPLYSVYTGTKGYIKHLSESLHAEYKNFGIFIQCQVPSYVVTNLTPGLKPSFFIPTPSQYARSAVRCIGYESQLIPYWSHFLEYALYKLCPAEFILDKLVLKASLRIRMRSAKRAKEKTRRLS
ncbi:very-long-chain 3-oxoacyl-CoA reductase 1-like [Wolffia australiana]